AKSSAVATQQSNSGNSFVLTVAKCTSRGNTITSGGNALEHFIPNNLWRVVHLVLFFVTYVVDLMKLVKTSCLSRETLVDDGGLSFPRLMHLINNNICNCLDFLSMTKYFEERHNIFISEKIIKVLTMNSRADLKDVSEDF
nr:hypothetical protein [Tanacetum cinerariifolium]